MIGFEKAVEIAKDQYKIKGVEDIKIGTVYETDGKWIFFSDLGDLIETGSLAVLVNKEDGKAELKGYPSRELHKVLNSARKVR